MGEEMLTCTQCGEEFPFSDEDWERYQQMGFDPPRRCPSCRRQKQKAPAEDQPRHRRRKKRDYHRKNWEEE